MGDEEFNEVLEKCGGELRVLCSKQIVYAVIGTEQVTYVPHHPNAVTRTEV